MTSSAPPSGVGTNIITPVFTQERRINRRRPRPTVDDSVPAYPADATPWIRRMRPRSRDHEQPQHDIEEIEDNEDVFVPESPTY